MQARSARRAASRERRGRAVLRTWMRLAAIVLLELLTFLATVNDVEHVLRQLAAMRPSCRAHCRVARGRIGVAEHKREDLVRARLRACALRLGEGMAVHAALSLACPHALEVGFHGR